MTINGVHAIIGIVVVEIVAGSNASLRSFSFRRKQNVAIAAGNRCEMAAKVSFERFALEGVIDVVEN